MDELPYMFQINIPYYKKKISIVIKNLFLQYLKQNEFLDLLFKYNKDDIELIKQIGRVENIREKRMNYLMQNAAYLIINFRDKILYKSLPIKMLKDCIIYEINKTKRFINYIHYISSSNNRVELLNIIDQYNIDLYENECNILFHYLISIKLNNYYIYVIKKLNDVQLNDLKCFIISLFNNRDVEKMTNSQICNLCVNIYGIRFPIYCIKEIKIKLNIYTESSLLYDLKNA
jgi:hypothetical protein